MDKIGHKVQIQIPVTSVIYFVSTRAKFGTSTGTHCKDKMPKILNKYSQKRHIGASVPISTFICLWTNYIFPRWICLFCWRKYVDRSWELYINRSETHECGNWGWGRAIPRKGIYKRNCRCSAGLNMTLHCAHFSFNKFPIQTHAGANVKFSTIV
jgi:hypothetical protein